MQLNYIDNFCEPDAIDYSIGMATGIFPNWYSFPPQPSKQKAEFFSQPNQGFSEAQNSYAQISYLVLISTIESQQNIVRNIHFHNNSQEILACKDKSVHKPMLSSH
jgi:hypothetical protein